MTRKVASAKKAASARKRSSPAARPRRAKASRRAKPTGVVGTRRKKIDLEGPPPRETLVEPSDLEREQVRPRDRASTPKLTGGDVDADWIRAATAGDEAVGGSEPTPDQDVVDDLGDALGVPRGPDEEFRPSLEILEQRDRRRAELER
jgi:hypothetical protein